MTLKQSSRIGITIGSIGLLLLIGAISGVGSYIGNRMAQQAEAPNPLMLHAGTAARGKSVSMATGLIDPDVEGLFILDHQTGELQCWVLGPRNGAVGGIYRANVAVDMGNEKGGEAEYVMTTGNFFFTGNNAGNQVPGNSICYVSETKSGKVIGYGLIYDKQAIRRGLPQSGDLKPICNGTITGEGATRDQ